MLMRWWRELRRPELKCARLGHDCKPRLYRGYCLPGEVSGYEGEHQMPESWECVEWKARGGYGSQGENQARENSAKERIYFSPHCLRGNQGHLFAEVSNMEDVTA